jgi:hypothetical protein
MAASKPVLLMFMIASIASGIAAFLLAAAAGSQFLFYSLPGFVIGAFFAVKYVTFDRNRAREEEHRKRRSKH